MIASSTTLACQESFVVNNALNNFAMMAARNTLSFEQLLVSKQRGKLYLLLVGEVLHNVISSVVTIVVLLVSLHGVFE